MIVTYQPDGSSEPRTWSFRPGRVKASQAEMIERRWAGGADPESGPSTYQRWLIALDQGEARARRVLLWHLLSQEHRTLRFDDVDCTGDELVIEPTKAEVAEQIDAIRAGKLPIERKERALAWAEQRLADAPDDPDGQGKAT